MCTERCCRCRAHRRRCVAGKGGCFSRRLEAQGRMQPPLEGKSTLPIINSFLNLCRVCPVPTDDKVNSEYKRNFTWHDGYQTTKVEVVRNAPSIPSCAEPSLPRKKKYPCAPARDYLLYNGETDAAPDAIDADSRARIPDEDTRSVTKATDDVDRKRTEEKQMSGGDVPLRTEEGYVPKTTEYRSQFVAYPRTPDACPARKSASMGLIGKKDVVDGEVPCADSWSVMPSEDVDDAALDAVKRGRIKKTEYKAKFRPFSAYTYVDGNWKKATRLIKDSEDHPNAWYSEVVERLKKADQYKTRSYTGNEATEILSPVAASSRTWKDDRPAKERGRSAVPVHHKKEADHSDAFKHRDGSMKKKPQVEKTTARPKSAEPVIPVSTKPEHRSPKRSRPRAPRDLPLKGHGDLSGRKKKHGSPSGKSKGKVWLKSDGASKQLEEQGTLLNGFVSEEEPGKMVNGEVLDDSVLEEAKLREEYPKGPVKVPLTSVKSPEEMTGVRSPDPESWTVPLDIGKGLHWMDGKTPDGIQAKGPPILLSKRFKESSLIGKSQKDLVLCDPGTEVSEEAVDL